jgi:hypothetical protein
MGRMKRGLLKELANNATAMACGYRPFHDLSRLADLSGSVVVVDLMTGGTRVDGDPVGTPLGVGEEIVDWFHDQTTSQRVPSGVIESASLTICPTLTDGHLVLQCETTIRASTGSYRAQDSIRWHARDVVHDQSRRSRPSDGGVRR